MFHCSSFTSAKFFHQLSFEFPFFSILTPFKFSFYPSFRSLHAANFSQSHPRFPLLQPTVVASLNVSLFPWHISPCLSSEPTCFSITQITVSRATLHCDARHPVAAACSCNLRPRRTTRSGTRQMLPRFFVPPATAPLSPRYCFPRVFRTFALFACMVIWNAPRVPKRCGPPFVVIFLFTLGGWTIPRVMLFEVFVFANFSCCNLLSLTVKFCFSIVSLFERQRFS